MSEETKQLKQKEVEKTMEEEKAKEEDKNKKHKEK